MSTTTDPLAGFKSRLETALLATLPEQTNQQQGAGHPSRLASTRWRPGRRRLVIALAGLTAGAVAVIALGPALLAPERPGVAAFAVQPSAGGKLRVTLNGSLESPRVRRELARALREYGVNARFLLVPGPERLAGRVLSKDHTQPLKELTYDRARLGPGGEQVPGVVNINLYIPVGVRGHGPAVEVAHNAAESTHRILASCQRRRRYRSDTTDTEWVLIQPLLPHRPGPWPAAAGRRRTPAGRWSNPSAPLMCRW